MNLFKNDVGIQIIYNVIESLEGVATTVGFHVAKPDGTEVDWNGSVFNKSRILYTIKSGDLNQTGKYRLQPFVSNTDGLMVHGEEKSFVVSEPL